MPTNLFIYGTSGTGKTLMLVEALRIKVAYHKMFGDKPIKVIIGTYQHSYSGNDQLKKDLIKKYNLQRIMEEYNVQPKTIHELSKGNDFFT